MKEWKGRSWRSREERGRGVDEKEVTAGVKKVMRLDSLGKRRV